jgi:hypothetical protein
MREGSKSNFRKQGVETMDLLALLDVGIVLSDTSECKFIHEINFMRSIHMFVLLGIKLVVVRRIEFGHTLKSFTIRGKVAEKSMT